MDASVIEMGKLLFEVQGGNTGQIAPKAEIQAAADAILQPLMDLLDGERSKNDGKSRESFHLDIELLTLDTRPKIRLCKHV